MMHRPWSYLFLYLLAVPFAWPASPALAASQRRQRRPFAVAPPRSEATTRASSALSSSSKVALISKTTDASASSLQYIQCVSFLLCTSASLVALAPVQAMMQLKSGNRSEATRVLSVLSTFAALLELMVAPLLGQQLDARGRKPILRRLILTLVVLHVGTAWRPVHIVSIALQKLVGTVLLGFFLITIQTILRDLTQAHGTSSLPTVLGQQGALMGAGFLLGIVGAGRISPYGFGWVYGTAAALALGAGAILQWRIAETRPPDAPPAAVASSWSWQSVTAGTHLLTRYGPRVRRLAILYMLMTVHLFMGDLFQIYAATEWHLSTAALSTYLSLVALTGIAANVVGSLLVRRLGLAAFTTLAILSKLLTSTMTAFFGVRGSMVGLVVGFLGSAQSIGVMAALMNEGPSASGSMAGERAALTALLKVLGPVLYGTLYIQGQRLVHRSNVPFLFNMGLSVAALILSRYCF